MAAKQREFEVVLEPQEEGGYTVYAPALPGCISEGDTRDEAIAAITEAIEGYLEALRAHGESVPCTDSVRVAA